QTLVSNLQGNIIDLCPVGALTSKPYAFTARPWELTKTESIDVMDGLGSNIRVDVKGREVMRILPRNHDGVNEEWLSDRSRYVWDGLRRQRLDRPYVRRDGKLMPASWGEAFAAIKDAVAGKSIAAVAGDLAPVEAMYALKELATGLGGQVECRVDGAKLPLGNRSAYVGTAAIEDIDTADMILLVGTNPRLEAPVLNARIRKAWLAGAEVGRIGPVADLTYDVAEMGADRAALAEAVKRGVSDATRDEKSTLVILGQGAVQGEDGAAVLAEVQAFCEASNSKLLILHTSASRVGALDIGFATEGGMDALGEAEVIYNLCADEIDIAPGAFVIYQGSHGDRGAHRADVILPGAAYTEESGLFVNTEGRPQMAARAGFPPGDAKENWAIMRALSAELGATLPYNSLAELRTKLVGEFPHLGAIDVVPLNEWQAEPRGTLGTGDLTSPITHHYQTNPILRASQTMAELAKLAADHQTAVAAE
ncbi:MAG: molybdopterin-dependent oxidoreductase, partial [Pseudomonadota bacterium]